MRRWVGIVTLLAALALVAGAVLDIDPPRDLDRAWSAYRTGDYDQCLRLARRAGLITDDTRLVLRSLEMQARGALGLKRPDMARQYLDRMLAIAPRFVWALLLRGSLALQAGRVTQALADLERGIELAVAGQKRPPKYLAPYYARRGMARLKLGRLGPAEQDARTGLALDAFSPEPHYLLCRVFERMKQFHPALESCERALELIRRRDHLFFMTPEGKGWIRRLVILRRKAGVDSSRPLLPSLAPAGGRQAQ